MALDFPANPTNGQVYDNFYYDSSMGTWRSLTVAPVQQIPAGVIELFAGASAPGGYLLCTGQSLATADYPALFSAIGYTYGGSGGSFTIPNLQNRVPVAKGTGTFANLGSTGGAETVTLDATQIPSHTHPLADHTHTFSGTTSTTGDHNHAVKTGQGHDDNNGLNGQGANAQIVQESDIPRHDYWSYTSNSGGAHTHTYSGTTSGASALTANGQSGTVGQAHTNLQPYIVLNYIIKT